MGDPFRGELETAHARIGELEARVAELETENTRLRAGHPPLSRVPTWVPAVAVGGGFLALVVAFGIFLAVWQFLSPSDRAPPRARSTPALVDGGAE